MSGHTPTPWTKNRQGQLFGADDIYLGAINGPKDAALAVRAVNSHADLVAALKGAKDAWEALPAGVPHGACVVQEWITRDMKPALDAVRTALAKAEAQS